MHIKTHKSVLLYLFAYNFNQLIINTLQFIFKFNFNIKNKQRTFVNR